MIMMIYRKIYRCETVGSRATKNLRPKLSDETPQGINYRVLEYDEKKNTCILEAWCSDHEILKPEHRKNMADLNQLSSRPYMLETVEKHAKSPKILGCLSVTETLTGPQGQGLPKIAQPNLGKINPEAKTIEWKSQLHSYIRRHEGTDTVGRKILDYVLDEG